MYKVLMTRKSAKILEAENHSDQISEVYSFYQSPELMKVDSVSFNGTDFTVRTVNVHTVKTGDREERKTDFSQ